MVLVGLLECNGGSGVTNSSTPAPEAITLSQMLNVMEALLDSATHTETERAVARRTTGPANIKGNSNINFKNIITVKCN
jgi:hypothetical protein